MWKWLLRKKKQEHETVKLMNGEPIDSPIQKENGIRFVEHYHKCCDCGLRHDVRINIGRKILTFHYWRE